MLPYFKEKEYSVLFLEHLSSDLDSYVADFMIDKPLPRPLMDMIWYSTLGLYGEQHPQIVHSLCDLIQEAKNLNVQVCGLPAYSDHQKQSVHSQWRYKIGSEHINQKGSIILAGRLHFSPDSQYFGGPLHNSNANSTIITCIPHVSNKFEIVPYEPQYDPIQQSPDPFIPGETHVFLYPAASLQASSERFSDVTRYSPSVEEMALLIPEVHTT